MILCNTKIQWSVHTQYFARKSLQNPLAYCRIGAKPDSFNQSGLLVSLTFTCLSFSNISKHIIKT